MEKRRTLTQQQEQESPAPTHEKKSSLGKEALSFTRRFAAGWLAGVALWNVALEAGHYTGTDSYLMHAHFKLYNGFHDHHVYPGSDTPGLSEQTSRAASSLLDANVKVNCFSPESLMESVVGTRSEDIASGQAFPAGFVLQGHLPRVLGTNIASRPIWDNVINLEDNICKSVVDFEKNGSHGSARKETKERIDSADEPSVAEMALLGDDTHHATTGAAAVSVLAHEYSHVRLDSQNEALVQCAALDLTPGIMQRSQQPPDAGELEAMKALVYSYTNESMPGDYRSTDCYKGGPYDVRAQSYKNLPVGNDAPTWLPEQYEIASWGGGDSGEPETVYYVSELDSDDLGDVK